ncbi:hypothetical protein ACFMQL_34540 [Nonomuraea fastidiosa]|uniref:hypothetical protein n=1 Tax=Nonomuraea TaxID=83681 RepID=UPI0032457228
MLAPLAARRPGLQVDVLPGTRRDDLLADVAAGRLEAALLLDTGDALGDLGLRRAAAELPRRRHRAPRPGRRARAPAGRWCGAATANRSLVCATSSTPPSPRNPDAWVSVPARRPRHLHAGPHTAARRDRE